LRKVVRSHFLFSASLLGSFLGGVCYCESTEWVLSTLGVWAERHRMRNSKSIHTNTKVGVELSGHKKNQQRWLPIIVLVYRDRPHFSPAFRPLRLAIEVNVERSVKMPIFCCYTGELGVCAAVVVVLGSQKKREATWPTSNGVLQS
jgi:hypothetical protein